MRYGSGGLGLACGVWVWFGDAAQGDFEAEGAELADVTGDLAADAGLALVSTHSNPPASSRQNEPFQ